MDADVAALWDANAETWARHVRAGYDAFRELYNNPAFFSFVGDLRGWEVLDAGCGEGYNTRLCARAGARMAGIDISPRMIELARKEEVREPLGIRYQVAPMSALPFAAASFDAVISTMALMDAPDYDANIREFHRVLRPGGLLAFNLQHPCFTYRHVHGVQEIADGDAEVTLRMGAYFAEASYEESWRFRAAPAEEGAAPFTIRYFDRTLASVINPLCAAGFRLEAILEPRPSDDACRRHPALRKHRIIPQTLCVKARRE